MGLGSRTLCVWFNADSRYLHVRTYRFGTPTGDDFGLMGHNDINLPPVSQWFFIYHAYSHDSKKQVFHVKFAES